MSRLITFVFLIGLNGPLPAQTPAATPAPPALADAVHAAFTSALEEQVASVRRQAALPPSGISSGDGGFFTVPFATPPPLGDMASADCEPIPKKELDPIVEEAAQKGGVKADLIQAVIQQESGGKPCAVSPKGAMGLMQLMPATVTQMNVADAFDPAENVAAGVKLLKQLLDKYHGDTSLALSAYNAGEKRVDEAQGVPPIAETKNYVNSIAGQLTQGAAGGGAASPAQPPQP